MSVSSTTATRRKFRVSSLKRTVIISMVLKWTGVSVIPKMQGVADLISNVADVTSGLANGLIEGGLGLFQTHGTVPAGVYNTLDKKKKKKKRKIYL